MVDVLLHTLVTLSVVKSVRTAVSSRVCVEEMVCVTSSVVYWVTVDVKLEYQVESTVAVAVAVLV